jgi:predicted transposase YbfD/YdcC
VRRPPPPRGRRAKPRGVDRAAGRVTGPSEAQARRHTATEKGHGREETRSHIQVPVPATLRGLELWKGWKSIGTATSVCVRDGKETTETCYSISSLPRGVEQFAHAIRSHWGIYNSCHWSLDLTYREDESRIQDKHMRENFAWLNRFTLSLLKQHPGKDGIVRKRRACGWNDDLLLEVPTGITPQLQLALLGQVFRYDPLECQQLVGRALLRFEPRGSFLVRLRSSNPSAIRRWRSALYWPRPAKAN